ncbi:MAG: heavy-metal-associated domain-containing protein [Actinomycetota bacterium]
MATERSLEVWGMDCTGCENRVKTAVTRLEGVIKADADHRAARVDIRFDHDRVSEDEIKERIRAAGYEVA